MGKTKKDQKAVEQARMQAMNATQWLARLARSYDAGEDDVELRWDPRSRRIVTPEIAPGVAVGMALPTLILQFDENGEPSQHPIDLDGKSSTEVEAWILIELLHRGIDRDKFSKALPYQPTHLMSGEEPKFSPQNLMDELRQLTKAYEAAADVLTRVRASLSGYREDHKASAVFSDLVCWPEHMEIGFAAPIFGSDPDDGHIKIGFTVGDTEDGGPRYFLRRETTASETPIDPLILAVEDMAGMSPSEMCDAMVEKIKGVTASAAH